MTLSPKQIYLRLCDGKTVPGLAQLPMADIVARFEQDFAKGWRRPIGEAAPKPRAKSVTMSWEKKRGRGAFQLSLSARAFRVDCYGVATKDLNRIVDIGLAFDCPLYDPQVDQRYSLG